MDQPASRNPFVLLFNRFASRLKFPQLFAFTLALFLLDLLIPDLVPFVDEVLLGLGTLLLGMWQNDSPPREGERPPIKDITPPHD